MTTPRRAPRKAPRRMNVEQLQRTFTSDAGHELWQKVAGIAEIGIGAIDHRRRRSRRRRERRHRENW